MTSKKDAATIKALEELGLRKDPQSIPPQIADLAQQLARCEDEMGSIDPEVLAKYLIKPPKS